MRKPVTLVVATAFLVVLAPLAQQACAAGPPPSNGESQSVAPPVRPLPLTPVQFQALQATEATPAHRAAQAASATYAPPEEGVRWTTVSDDFWTVVYQVGWPAAYGIAMICAAPL